MSVIPAESHGVGDQLGDLPVAIAILRLITLRTRWMRRSALVKVPSFSRNVQPGKKTWRNWPSRQKQILHHDQIHRGEAGGDVLGVGIGLENVLALDVKALESAVDGGVEHIGMRSPGSGSSLTPHSASNSARTASFEIC